MTDSPASKPSVADRVRAALERKDIERSLAVDVLAALDAPPRETPARLTAQDVTGVLEFYMGYGIDTLRDIAGDRRFELLDKLRAVDPNFVAEMVLDSRQPPTTGAKP